MKNTIDQKTCTNCKLCTIACPTKIIVQNEENQIHFQEERLHLCVKCGQCMAVCKNKAVFVEGFSYEKHFVNLNKESVDYDQFSNFLAGRRSVRNFKPKALDEDLIEKLLASVDYAPNGSHPEKMHITVINNRKKIEEALPHISSFLDNIVKLIENPLISFIFKKFKRKDEFNTIKNHIYPMVKDGRFNMENGDGLCRGAHTLFILHAEKDTESHRHNALIYSTYMSLAAHSLDLGATMIEVVTPGINNVKKVREIWGIPESHNTVMTLIVGYPKIKYLRGIKRDFTKTHRL